MKKLFTMLLCLIVGIGSMNAKDIASGTFKNGGSWKITDQGELYVDAVTVPDFVQSTSQGTNAPWIPYKGRIKSIRFSSRVQTIGKNAFAFLPHVQKVPRQGLR